MGSERSGQAESTRRRLLDAAERLFAAHGVAEVSNRQISEAAGQGNNYAVGYHFGSREGLLKALLETRNAPIETLRQRMVDDLGYITDCRDWLRCLTRPQYEYIGTAADRTHFAQCWQQMTANPAAADLLLEVAMASPALIRILDGLYASLPELPADALTVRNMMTQNVLIGIYASFEKSRNDGDALDTESWQTFADATLDAMVGLWLAPVTSGLAT